MNFLRIAARVAEVIDAQERFWRASIIRALEKYPEDHEDVSELFNTVGMVYDFPHLANLVEATRRILDNIATSEHTSENCCREAFNEVGKIARNLNKQIETSIQTVYEPIPIDDLENEYDDEIQSYLEEINKEDTSNLIRFPRRVNLPHDDSTRDSELQRIIDEEYARMKELDDELWGMFDRRENVFNDKMMKQWKEGLATNGDRASDLRLISRGLMRIMKTWNAYLEFVVNDTESGYDHNSMEFEIDDSELTEAIDLCSNQVKDMISRWLFRARQSMMKLNKILEDRKSDKSPG